ncbi:YuiB family protein [Gorillibacterium massiliense]|uniref:YuiB family protein n=1 Tax=Gorillibacterium massiliense TaxID=1280390 RepID=UPI0004B4BF86|nr:YuiB family protein [Gorillibacterium massiliense]
MWVAIIALGGQSMIIELIQLFLLIVISFVLFFGIGFIVNMLLKTTWLPIYLAVAVIVILLIYLWKPSVSIGSNLTEYGFADILSVLSGIGGAALSGYTIKTLRFKGYKMF